MALAPAPPRLRPVGRTWTHRHPVVFLVGFVVLAESAGLAGARFAARSQAWYSHPQRPTFAPPSWVFAPVWTVLSAAIGVAAWLVWRHHRTWQRDVALRWWAVQLALHAVWTLFFFGARQPTWALVDLVLLAAAAVITTVRFLPFDRRASALFLPYLAWLGFALALNAAIVAMD